MKYFESMRTPFQNLNIQPGTQRITLKNLFFLAICITTFSWSVIFLLVEAKTIEEFAESFYVFAIGLFIFTILIILIWKKEIIFEIMDDFERTVQKRMIFLIEKINYFNGHWVIRTGVSFIYQISCK